MGIRLFAVLIFALTTSLSVGAQAQPDVATLALQEANDLASSGKLKQAIPKYREALKADPGGNPLAYYNLGEVYRALKNCRDAVFMLQLYASVSQTEEARKEADSGIQKCRGTKHPKLAVEAKPDESRVFIDGFLASNGSFGPLPLPPGRYEVKVEAKDHKTIERQVKLGKEGASISVELEEKTFFGKVRVETNVDGARVRVFSGPSDETEVLHDLQTPMKESVEVEEGRHFVEVTADGFDRWIRNVSVLRDDEAVVKVKLTPSESKKSDE